MNTKVKVGIAAAIVAALVALIVLDQNTTPGTPAPVESSETNPTAGTTPQAPDPPLIIRRDAPASDQADEEMIFRQAREQFSPTVGSPQTTDPTLNPIKETPEPNQKEVTPAPSQDPDPLILPENLTPVARETAPAVEYVIQEGDTYEDIAKAHYGSRRLWGVIAKANPQMPANRLRVGKKIQIPAKPEASAGTRPSFEPDAIAGDRYYVVRPGDTLSGISVKVFNTSRHTTKIYDANREVIDDPNFLVVGTKLYMPELAVRRPSSNTRSLPGAGTAATAAAVPAGAKVHEVKANESLWKIAEKYAEGRGILQTIRDIVGANGDKLKSDASLLRVGWKLVIPE